MGNQSEGQVQLSKLIFTNNWEDPLIDEKVLQIKEGQTLFAITSGCCNALGFLRFQPKTIYCVDINPAQNHLMELKQAAFRRLNYNEMTGFFGLNPSNERREVFEILKTDLSEEAIRFWKTQMSIVKKGLLMNGRYENFVKIAGFMIRVLQGPKKVKRLFELNSLEDQAQFYQKEWNNKRWQWIFKTMFNKKRLAKKGLNADYFHFDDGSNSFSESFQKRAAHAICDLPIKENYFLMLYLLGKYPEQEFLPPYLQQKNFELIKTSIDRIQPISADSKYWLEQQTDNLFDGMALSNICELMDEKDTEKLFREVIRTSKSGSKLIFRNLMIPRDVPKNLATQIIKDPELSRKIQFDDRSFVYGKVAAYMINN